MCAYSLRLRLGCSGTRGSSALLEQHKEPQPFDFYSRSPNLKVKSSAKLPAEKQNFKMNPVLCVCPEPFCTCRAEQGGAISSSLLITRDWEIFVTQSSLGCTRLLNSCKGSRQHGHYPVFVYALDKASCTGLCSSYTHRKNERVRVWRSCKGM